MSNDDWLDSDDELLDAPGTDDELEVAPVAAAEIPLDFLDEETGGPEEVEEDPIPDDNDSVVVPSKVSAIIRTVTPYLVSYLISALTWAFTPLGVALPDGAQAWLETALPIILGSLYYLLAKVLEKRWPNVPWLGSTRLPLYTAPARLAPQVATLASVGYVWWRGGRFTPAFRDSLVAVDKEAPGFVLTQGGFNGTKVSASAGTHAGDSADFSVRGKTEAQVAKFISEHRKRGNAAWFRTKRKRWGVRAQGFAVDHIHIVPNGYAAPSPAAARQIEASGSRGYRNGRDGLSSNQPDVGPGHVSTYRTRTWFDFLKLANKPVPETTDLAPIPRHYTKKPWMVIPVSGRLDGVTLSRLQWQLNVKPTGKLDSNTIRALRVWLGNADGPAVLSPLNIRQLQYRVGLRGAAQDGIWNSLARHGANANVVSPTTKALQRFLNENR